MRGKVLAVSTRVSFPYPAWTSHWPMSCYMMLLDHWHWENLIHIPTPCNLINFKALFLFIHTFPFFSMSSPKIYQISARPPLTNPVGSRPRDRFLSNFCGTRLELADRTNWTLNGSGSRLHFLDIDSRNYFIVNQSANCDDKNMFKNIIYLIKFVWRIPRR